MIDKIDVLLDIAVDDMSMSGDIESHSYHQGIADITRALLVDTPFKSIVRCETDVDIEAYLDGVLEAIGQIKSIIEKV